VERSIRPIALNRKNALFAGSDGGGEHWAVIASLIEICKLNGIDPYAYLIDVISRIVNGHPNSRIDELLPGAIPLHSLRRGGLKTALMAWLGFAWLGFAWLGFAWLCLAWLGLAWLCFALLGLAWLGLAWLGLAWLGLAWLSLA
jgi:hypothetical protein